MSLSKPIRSNMEFEILVIALMCWITLSSGQSCIDNPKANQRGNATLGSGRQVIVPKAVFCCSGRVTNIIASFDFSNSVGDLPIIQMWRPLSLNSSVYNRIGQVQVANTTLIKDHHHFTNITISTSSKLEFQPGDVIGYYQPSDLRLAIWNSNQTSGYTSYSTNVTNSITTINISDENVIRHNRRQPLIEVLFATGEDSGYVFSTEMIVGAVVVSMLLLIIIFCAVGCCVIWVRRKKTYPVSSVYYSNVKSINNLEGHGETFGHNETSESDTLAGDNAVYSTIRASATYENPKDYIVPDYLKPHDYVTLEEALTCMEGVYESPVQLDVAMEDEQMIYDTPCDDDEDYGPIYTEPPNDLEKIYEIIDGKKLRKLFHWNIRSVKSLGSGEFGVVTQGVLSTANGVFEVAIKALNSNAKDKDKVRFLQEAAIMCQFDHENVIKLYGVVIDAPEMIVLEYMSRGDLRKLLHALQPSSEETVYSKLPLLLLKFCQETAAGMAYLSGKQFVHRDLAARNVLISEKYICKIADFGMSRDLLDDNYYITSGGKIPVKWTSPEATHYKKYSTQSDVWSFGCLLYEIWSLGHKPFDELSNIEVMEKLDRGHRLPPPPGCSRTMYKLMVKCWHPDPRSRPQFGQITKLLAGNGNYLLGWSDEDKQVAGEDGMKFGAPLECTENLYYDLQTTYNQNVSL